jgi:hypothetical protein
VEPEFKSPGVEILKEKHTKAKNDENLEATWHFVECVIRSSLKIKKTRFNADLKR